MELCGYKAYRINYTDKYSAHRGMFFSCVSESLIHYPSQSWRLSFKLEQEFSKPDEPVKIGMRGSTVLGLEDISHYDDWSLNVVDLSGRMILGGKLEWIEIDGTYFVSAGDSLTISAKELIYSASLSTKRPGDVYGRYSLSELDSCYYALRTSSP